MKKISGSVLNAVLLIRLLLIFNFGLLSFIEVFSQSATISPSTTLNEVSLDDEYITVTLGDGETFIDYLNLKIDSFALAGEAPGTVIEAVTGISNTVAQIDLHFNGTDFDVEYPYFHVIIDDVVLTQSAQDLFSDSLSINYALEPVITNVSIPNDTMRIGSVLIATITVEDDEDDTFSLGSESVVGGYPLTNLIRINNTTYTSSFTITEGGIDYAAYEDIPVQIQLLNDTISGNLFTTPIIQDSDLLDANRSVIQYIYTTIGGAQNIGSEIILWIQTDGPNYTFTLTSHVNNVPVSNQSIEIVPNGTRYVLTYTVGEGDNDVGVGELILSMVAVDEAGNIGVEHTSILENTLSIDASRPSIDQAYISSTDSMVGVGDILTIIVRADQSGYRNHPDSRINNVPVGPDVTFTDLGSNLYQYSYTVRADHGVVYMGALAINIVLQDHDPYENTSYAFTNLDLPWIPPGPPPYAIVSGSTEICYGNSAFINVELGGIPPWWFAIFDGSATDTIYTDQTKIQLLTTPLSTTNYTVPKVGDATGNSNVGSGNALITVHPLPNVQILNLQSIYDSLAPPVVLNYTPADGTFIGPGITPSAPWIFTPSVAGIEDSPHEIVCTYTDENGCTNADTVNVQVVDASISFGIDFEKSVACSNDSTFLITTWNTGNYVGSFFAEPEPPPGAFTDNGNNTAVLRPILFDLTSDLDLTITYTVIDLNDVELFPKIPLTIEYLEDAEIFPFASNHFCENEDPIDLTGYPAGGSFFGSGITGNVQDGFSFEPSQANLDTNIIQYIYTSDRGCTIRDSIDLIVHFAPVANFSTKESCISGAGGQIQFENLSDTGNYQVESWKWNFEYPSNNEENLSDLENPTHFYNTGNWTVKLLVEIDNSCIDSTEKIFNVSPTYTLIGNSYYENFEDSLHGWNSISLDTQYQNSWTIGEVDSTKFPWNTSSGTRAWYTDIPVAQTIENSWVQSPCFNFGGFSRPMVSLDIKRSLDRNNDGATLQYTVDNGNNWITLGGINEGGINWYNSDSIWDGPGNLKTGWTGEQDFSEDSLWYKSAYWLDELIGHDNIQFRIAFSSNGDTTVQGNGFAFDNFTIKQRTRLSVLEYFTNANTSECYDTDLEVCNIMKQVPDDVIDIQYHARGSLADELFNDNQVPATNRGAIYGVTEIPHAVLDGGIKMDEQEHQMVYDFNSRSPNVEDIRRRSLVDPDFQLSFSVNQYVPTLELSVAVKALRDLEPKERTVYTVLLERLVDDPKYVGTNGIIKFRNVARKMLPGVAGTYLGSKGWSKDETKYFDLSDEPTFFSTANNNITIVVFIQDEETREILQATDSPEYYMYDCWSNGYYDCPEYYHININCETLTGQEEIKSQVLLYPNPAKEIVNVSFEGITKEEMQFTLYDLAGKIVISDIIEPWQQRYTRPLGDLEQGLYIIEIRINNDKQIFYRGKLFHY